jgi:hypothetical protein|tara:strand:+ start:668 stop:871 length:204 start_codon:yes stop_codon:yes gene_type:complete
MGFKSGNLKVGKADPLMGLPILTRDEVFYLLNIIRKSDFKGEEMEELFKLTLKLQRMFVDLDKWQDK